MKKRYKTLFAYIGILILLIIISIISYCKYFLKIELNFDKPKSSLSQNTNSKILIRSINNLNDIKNDNFSITDIDITFDKNKKVVSIVGNINNLTNKEMGYKILSSLYNKDKDLINSKIITIDTEIQPHDTIPFFVNHYYSELNININEISNYKLEIIE